MIIKVSDYLKITHYNLGTNKVDKPIKIAALGDLHLSKLVPNEVTDFLAYKLNIIQPNYITILGDSFDRPIEIEKKEKYNQYIKFIYECAKIAPVMIILGSHDFSLELKNENLNVLNQEFFNYLNTIPNVHVLNNSIYNNDEILFMGYTQPMDFYYNVENENKENAKAMYNDLLARKELFTNLPKDIFKIGLIHSPAFVQYKGNIELLSDYDIFLSAHYHEGCMPVILDDFIPGNTGIISPRKSLFPNISRGIKVIDETDNHKIYLIISGGIVKIQDCAPKILQPLNHLCYQQMDTITLLPSKENSLMVETERVYTKKRTLK